MIDPSAIGDPLIFPRTAWPKGRGPYYSYWPPLSPLVRRFSPDLIHFREEPYTVAAGQLMAERFVSFSDVPFIFETHQNIIKRYPRPATLVQRRMFDAAIGAIAGIPSVIGVLEHHGYRGPVEMIPLGGLDPAIFRQEGADRREVLGSGDAIIGFVGMLSMQKGVDILLRAVEKLPRGAILVLVGDGPDRDRFQAMARSMDVRVRFEGPVSQNAVPEYLRTFDVLVLPSRRSGTGQEQWGRVLTEAMACGTPVVASSIGEMPYVVGDAGLIFQEESVEDLSAALEKVLWDESVKNLLIDRGLARARGFTWDLLAERTEKFYYEVIR